MVNIYEDLAELNKPIYAEGAAPTTLPNEYYTVSEDYTSTNLSADNEAQEYLYEFTLKWYTNDANTLYSGLDAAIEVLKKKHYILSGVGYYNHTYKETWFSRQIDVNKIEYLKEDK